MLGAPSIRESCRIAPRQRNTSQCLTDRRRLRPQSDRVVVCVKFCNLAFLKLCNGRRGCGNCESDVFTGFKELWENCFLVFPSAPSVSTALFSYAAVFF